MRNFSSCVFGSFSADRKIFAPVNLEKLDCVAIGIEEDSDPAAPIGILRTFYEVHPFLSEFCANPIDIIHEKIHDGLPFSGRLEATPGLEAELHPTHIKARVVVESVFQWEPQNFLIKMDRAAKTPHGERDIPKPPNHFPSPLK